MKSQSVTTAVKWKNNPRTQFSLVWKESIAVENFYFLLIGNGNKQQQQKPTNNRISNKNAIASNTPRLSSVWLDASDCGSTKTTRLLHNALAIFWDRLLFLFFFSCPCCLSAWWLLTCRSTNHSCGIPTGRERFLSEGPRRTIWATIFHCILQENKIQTIWFFIFLYTVAAYDKAHTSVVFDVWILLCNAASSQCLLRDVSVIQRRRKDPERSGLQGFAVGHSDSVRCYEA